MEGHSSSIIKMQYVYDDLNWNISENVSAKEDGGCLLSISSTEIIRWNLKYG